MAGRGKIATLTHFDAAGAAHMVGVEAKPETVREATACGVVVMAPATARVIKRGEVGKGDVLAVARLAGIAAAKRTADLIPLCHPLRLTSVEVGLVTRRDRVEIRALVRALDRTGVEMEALTAVAIAGLTIYDMCKAIDRSMVVGPMWLEEKRGGRSGDWQRTPSARQRQQRRQPTRATSVARRR